jgi:hypothetical protein
VVDVDSLEKVEIRVAVKNLKEPQGNLNDKSICSFSSVRIKDNLGGLTLVWVTKMIQLSSLLLF